MNTIDFNEHVGMGISQAAEMLVRHWPARGVFNGIPIRARYATTHPCDIVRQYWWERDLKDIRYRHSAEGKCEAAEYVEKVRRKQAILNDLVSTRLPTFNDPEAVVQWVAEVVRASDLMGVFVDPYIAHVLNGAGFTADMNSDEHYQPDDPANSAGWIVGQFLAALPTKNWSGIHDFCEEWLKRWTPVEASPAP